MIERKGAAGDISTSVKYRSSELGSRLSHLSHRMIEFGGFGSVRVLVGVRS